MSALTIIYATSRHEPEFHWFYDSVRRESDCQIIVIDPQCVNGRNGQQGISCHPPKPTVWQGPHRLTKEDYWAKSNALNTGICLCRTDWLMCVDDRSVLLPGWFARIQAAMSGGYGVCGSYEKRHNLKVENGVITDWGTLAAGDPRIVRDHRADFAPAVKDSPGSWWFGCVNALPLEWALQVNGYEELLDSASMEDSMFGLMLANNGFPIKYDPQLKLIEDRTPERCGPAMKRTSKERWPHDTEDKLHKALARFGVRKRTEHHWDLRAIRAAVLRGEPFPPADRPTHDWHDGQAIRDF